MANPPRKVETQMLTYRLDPINPSDPQWDALSTIKQMVWVSAPHGGKARDLVAGKTAKLTPTTRYAPKQVAQSPWLDDKMATCVLDTAKAGVPEGAVMLANGQTL
jgi:hypothetical protein